MGSISSVLKLVLKKLVVMSWYFRNTT